MKSVTKHMFREGDGYRFSLRENGLFTTKETQVPAINVNGIDIYKIPFPELAILWVDGQIDELKERYIKAIEWYNNCGYYVDYSKHLPNYMNKVDNDKTKNLIEAVSKNAEFQSIETQSFPCFSKKLFTINTNVASFQILIKVDALRNIIHSVEIVANTAYSPNMELRPFLEVLTTNEKLALCQTVLYNAINVSNNMRDHVFNKIKTAYGISD